MSREAFVRLLVRATRDGLVDEAEAGLLLRRFDAGALSLNRWAPLEQMIVDVRSASSTVAGTLTQAMLVRVGPVAQLEMVDEIQAAFEINVRLLTQQFQAGRLPLARWQEEMAAQINDHLVRQTMAAQGWAELTPAQVQELEEILRREQAYLGRFADTITVRQAQGQPISEEAIANRAESYAGTGRGQAFRTLESGEAEPGWVHEYVAEDDGLTCDPCHQAQGYYLPGQGPMPGTVCLGRSRCRCRRVAVYDPRRWADLQ